ncbi:ParB/RepB/Spo0J family partition protein [bacterium]|nr:ParB/RepB/Spo0J family partition protein [bacterium]
MAVKRLGKGLGALIPDTPPADETETGRLSEIEVSKITPNPFQPREMFDPKALEELKQSIAENGVIQPITVREADSHFELIAGERRLRAVRDLGFVHIPAFILNVQTDQQMLELSLIENIQRENLNPVDEANGYQALIARCNLTQEEVATKVGKDRSTITNSLRILKLPKTIQDSLVQEEITSGHARALLGVETKAEQLTLWKKIVKKRYSVRQVEALVKKVREPHAKKKQKPNLSKIDPFLSEAEGRLRTALATRVSIVPSKNGAGRIEIDYFSTEELERIIELIDAD